MSKAGASVLKGTSEFKLSLSPCGNCGKETSQCCGNCRKESFCSVICQKARRKEHKLICFPAKEEIGEGYRYGHRINAPGSFWVATRDIEEGERIFTDYPLMTGPGQEHTGPGEQICLGCHKILKYYDLETDERKCGDCGWPLCGDNCPGIERHLKECEPLSWMREYNSEFVSLGKTACDTNGGVYTTIRILRLMSLMKNDPIKWESFLNLYVPDLVENRMTRICALDVKKFEIGFKFFKRACQLELTKEVMVRLSAAETFHHCRPYFGREDIAELLIYDKETRMDTSCMENCFLSEIPISKKINDPHGLVFVAAKPIKKGERLSIPFGGTPIWEGTKRRRETLMKNSHGDIVFICKCARCSDPTELGTNVSAIKCTKCNSGLLLPLNPLDDKTKWKCNTVECSGLVPASDVSRIVKKIQKEADALMLILESHSSDKRFNKDFAWIAQVTKFIDKYEKILNPHHYILLNVQRLIMNPYTHIILNYEKIRPNDFLGTDVFHGIDRYRKIAGIFLDIASKLFPPFSLRTMEAHFYMGMSKFFSAQQAVVQNRDTIDVVKEWLKQGISHRQSFMEFKTKPYLHFPFSDRVYEIQLECLGGAHENALELCRLTPNYRGIPDKTIKIEMSALCALEYLKRKLLEADKNK